MVISDKRFKILIIRMSSIGDVVLTSPLVRIIKDAYQQCTIDFVIKDDYQAIVRHNPYIDKVIVFKKTDGKTN